MTTDPWTSLGFEPDAPSKTKSIVSAAGRGLLEGAQALRIPGVSLPQTVTLGQAEAYLDRVAPVRDEKAESIVRRGAKLLPAAAIGPESVPLKAAQLSLGVLGGELAKAVGAGGKGQVFGEIAGLLGPTAIKGLKSFFNTPTEKFPSGLTKPRAIDSNHKTSGVISPRRQEETLNKLNQESKGLVETSLKKRLPILEEIEKGTDFEGKFSSGFKELQDLAKKANPTINTEPVRSLMRDTIEKYSGIPNLHGEAKKVISEIKAFGRRPAMNLDPLLRTYRSNNQKIKNIYETSRITGTQKEYVDFLTDMNRAIAQSFKSTLPEDSYFVRQFEDLNKEYGQYKNALKTQASLRPILDGNPTPANLKKLVDPKTQKRLSLAIGEEGAQEITQIAEDLQTASSAIKAIPKKDLGRWNALLPLAYLVDVPGILKAGIGLHKLKNVSSWIYGRWLSNPTQRGAYKEALNALKQNNIGAYAKAANTLKNIEEPEKDTWEELGFTPD